jgi:hypothetical protein
MGRAEALEALDRSVVLHRNAQPFSARDPPAVV